MYPELRTNFRFLHVLVGRIDSAGGLGVFVRDPGSHDDRAVSMIRGLFDGQVQALSTDVGTLQVRTRGLDVRPDWTSW